MTVPFEASIVVDVPPARLQTLFSNPVELVPAPGPGFVIAVRNADVFMGGNSTPPPSNSDVLPKVTVGPWTIEQPPITWFTIGADVWKGPSDFMRLNYGDIALEQPVVRVDNRALNLSAFVNCNLFGPILTSSLLDGGEDWAADDTFALESTLDNGSDALGVVDTVDGDGVILTYHFDGDGIGFQVNGEYILEDASGAGTGGQIKVLTVGPNGMTGTLSLRISYAVIPISAS